MTNQDPQAVREYELQTWSRCAGRYPDTFATLTGELVPLLADAAGILPGSRVLDLGCGPGHVARALQETGAEVSGIDFSQRMVELARELHPETRFQQADAEQIPESDNRLDAVVSNFVVHHLANPVRVFSEVARVLKPGGRFAFTVWGPVEEQSSDGGLLRCGFGPPRPC